MPFCFGCRRGGAAAAVENCKLGRAHPSPVPRQGHSCNLVISLIIVRSTSSLLSSSLSIDLCFRKTKVGTSCCPARSLISFSINLNALVAVNLQLQFRFCPRQMLFHISTLALTGSHPHPSSSAGSSWRVACTTNNVK